MNQVIEMDHKEKVEMYQLIEKDRLIEMLIEANNTIHRITPKITPVEYGSWCNNEFLSNKINKISYNIIYLVKIYSGSYEDKSEYEVFATYDKEYAEKWCSRYNKIIEDNKDRIQHYYDDENYDKPEPFWYDVIMYDRPYAKVVTVKWK